VIDLEEGSHIRIRFLASGENYNSLLKQIPIVVVEDRLENPVNNFKQSMPIYPINNGAEIPQLICSNLEKMVKFHKFLKLQQTSLDKDIDPKKIQMSLKRMEWQSFNHDVIIYKELLKDEQTQEFHCYPKDCLIITIQNGHNFPVVVNLLEFGCAGAIRINYPPPGGTGVVEKILRVPQDGALSIYVPLSCVDFAPKQVWKLIVTANEVDFTWLQQDSFKESNIYTQYPNLVNLFLARCKDAEIISIAPREIEKDGFVIINYPMIIERIAVVSGWSLGDLQKLSEYVNGELMIKVLDKYLASLIAKNFPIQTSSSIPIELQGVWPQLQQYNLQFLYPDGLLLKKILPLMNNNKSTSVDEKFFWKHGGNHVFIAGSFNNWAQRLPLIKKDNVWEIAVPLLPNKEYQYKFIVDGEWKCDPGAPTKDDGTGNINNFII